MRLKFVPALLLLNLSLPAFARDQGDFQVVQVKFSKALKLGARRVNFGSSVILSNVRYFANGKSVAYVPSYSGHSKDVSQPSDFNSSECVLSSNTQLKDTQTLVEQVTAFLGIKENEVEYTGSASQDTSIRVYKQFGVNDFARQNPLFDAYINVENGVFHCSSRQPFTQETLNSIFAGSGVEVSVLRPCRYDDVGHGVRKLVCE